MSESEDLGRKLYEACVSGSVPALESLIEKDELILNRVNKLTCFLSETPLHVAVLCGHLDFIKALLTQKSKLVTEFDTQGCSPLHLASTEGHVEITIKYLLGKQNIKDLANVKNKNGSTALDAVEHCRDRDLITMEIRDLLVQAGRQDLNPDGNDPPPQPQGQCKVLGEIRKRISRFWKRYFDIDPDWLKQVRGHLITAATLTATMAYQAILSPSGGVWQESGSLDQALPPGQFNSY
ncbi:hypothetical protein Vadar_029342 [Vaccinium darrowii]|uniref:Uncharacterized protein n=1 Tax=Vaccinium darrowii TaxID=229202 RepID=A0ACB7XKU5_9ERIC|nr:hypothetical protein Vadar_029342 [Vaccinium darrowii]